MKDIHTQLFDERYQIKKWTSSARIVIRKERQLMELGEKYLSWSFLSFGVCNNFHLSMSTNIILDIARFYLGRKSCFYRLNFII